MAQFKVTNPLAKPARSMVLDSSDINFDRLVLEACGGGMSEQSTSKAMAASRLSRCVMAAGTGRLGVCSPSCWCAARAAAHRR